MLFPDITDLQISPADVIGEIKKHINDHNIAWGAVNTLIVDKIKDKKNKAIKKEEKDAATAGASSEVS